ncbi:uncharacterized protein LOC121049408 isoform X2 [Rosa chinensis]|uniref:uncharacterized protein LOC121049408 isoform X2 n=1 Tax=Rosa chinensis TaxID=74649 RepID=UPI001AD8DEF1|nr:uncharacterized protein LOC121049408 isoform X2 [Rosa chinensis]
METYRGNSHFRTYPDSLPLLSLFPRVAHPSSFSDFFAVRRPIDVIPVVLGPSLPPLHGGTSGYRQFGRKTPNLCNHCYCSSCFSGEILQFITEFVCWNEEAITRCTFFSSQVIFVLSSNVTFKEVNLNWMISLGTRRLYLSGESLLSYISLLYRVVSGRIKELAVLYQSLNLQGS